MSAKVVQQICQAARLWLIIPPPLLSASVLLTFLLSTWFIQTNTIFLCFGSILLPTVSILICFFLSHSLRLSHLSVSI